MYSLFREGSLKNKIASQRKTHAPRRFLYLRETNIWWCEGGEEGEEKVHLLTHATARGVGKNIFGSLSQQGAVCPNPNLLNRFSQVTEINCPNSKIKCILKVIQLEGKYGSGVED